MGDGMLVVKDLIQFVKDLSGKIPVVIKVAVSLLVIVSIVITSDKAKVFLYGPEWYYLTDAQEGTVVYKTNTKLKSGMITVRVQFEIRYEDELIYIVEIQGLYNKNRVELYEEESNEKESDGKVSDEKESDEKENNEKESNEKEQESRFCLKVEKRQRDNMNNFKKLFQKSLEEDLEWKYGDKVNIQSLEYSEIQVAEIYYQDFDVNKSYMMYIIASGKEVRTVTPNEVIKRKGKVFIDLDKLDLDKSRYSNGIEEMVVDCASKINL